MAPRSTTEGQAIGTRHWKAPRESFGRCEVPIAKPLPAVLLASRGRPPVPVRRPVDGVGFSIAATAQPVAAIGPSGSSQSAPPAFRRNQSSCVNPHIRSQFLYRGLDADPFALGVLSRTRCLNRSRAFGAITRFTSGSALKLKPRNFRSDGRALVYLEFELVRDELRNALHHSLTCR
jgi:hypothetical protein